jgi:hypothetical protein
VLVPTAHQRFIGIIGKDTQVSEYSKKLKLTEHIKLLVAYVLLQFESLGDLCEHADKYNGLLKISKIVLVFENIGN